MAIKPIIEYTDFEKVDIRVGKVTKVEDFLEARNLSYKLWIDFGAEIGVKTSSAQIKKHQTKEDLIDKQVICVVNFAPKQIGPFKSEVLTLGVDDGTGDPSKWIILTPFESAPLGEVIK